MASYTINTSIFVDVPYWPLYSTDESISCVVPGPSQWFFHFGEEIVIVWTRRVSTVDVPESPIANCARGSWQQQRYDSLHCHEDWWDSVPPSVVFSKRWTEVVLQERAVLGSVYRLPWRYSLVQYYPTNVMRHNEHLLGTLCRSHFLWTRRTGMLPFIWLTFQVWFLWACPCFVPSDDSSKKVVTFPLVPVQQGLCSCIAVHLWNFMAYPTRCKFAVTQNVMQNVEHSFVTYSGFRC